MRQDFYSRQLVLASRSFHASANAAPTAHSEELVTNPMAQGLEDPAIHELVQRKSSALTIRFFADCPTPRIAPVPWDSYSFARPLEFVPLTVFALNSSMAYQRQKCP